MKIYSQLFNQIKELEKANFISSPIIITNLLKETYLNQDLLDYLKNNARKINFFEELSRFVKPNETYQTNSEITVPFIYCLLFLFDNNYELFNDCNLDFKIEQVNIDLILNEKYPDLDYQTGYKTFINDLAKTLYEHLSKLTELETYFVRKKFRVSGNPRISQIQFYIKNKLTGEEADFTQQILEKLNIAIIRKDVDGTRTCIKNLIRIFEAYNLDKSYIDNLLNS